MKPAALSLLALLLGMVGVPLVASVSGAAGLDGLVTGEAESYALRIEYDIPLPVGPGTIPHTVGEIRRTSAGENAKGIAGAPTRFDAVVAGTYVNPNQRIEDPADWNRLPQAECFYPGDLVDVYFGFPTDTRTQTEPLPTVSQAVAKCGAGPVTDLRGTVRDFKAPGITARDLESTSLMRTDGGVDRADTAARASNIDIAGVVRIGSVSVSGSSAVTGNKGGNATSTRVDVSDVSVGGLTFSIAGDRLVVAGQSVPVGGPDARAVVDQANTLLTSSGCRVDVIDNPQRYPQGFLFSRPEPRVGLADDGSFAGSMRAGLLVLCDVPESLTLEDLNPQRVQVVVGFAYTAAGATEDPGGFGIGDLGGGISGISTPSTDTALPSLRTPVLPDAGTDAVAPSQPRSRNRSSSPEPVRAIATIPMPGATRLTLFLVCAVAWAFLTHFGITRLRRAT